MDFKAVLTTLLNDFTRYKIHYALIGGFALGLWGVGRATVDLDFLVHRDDLDKIKQIMSELGYELHYSSENVSQFISPLKVFGEIDFLHAFRELSLEMLKNSVEKDIFNSSAKIKVLRPEDLIGLKLHGIKLHGIKNDPSRAQSDLQDIKSLLSLHHDTLDYTLIKKYFTYLKIEDLYQQITGDAHKMECTKQDFHQSELDNDTQSLNYDMQWIASHRHNPFVKDTGIDVDAYIEFVSQYNEFINHEPKKFKAIIDREMIL